jgi:hypothetical protein
MFVMCSLWQLKRSCASPCCESVALAVGARVAAEYGGSEMNTYHFALPYKSRRSFFFNTSDQDAL